MLRKSALLFGLLAGIIVFAYTMIVMLVIGDFGSATPEELQTAEALGWLRYIILLLGVLMGMRALRKETTGQLGYGKVLAAGIGVSLVTAFFIGLMEFTYVQFMNPDFYEQYIQIAEKQFTNPDDLKAFREQVEMFPKWATTGWGTGVFYFIETFIIGLLMSLLAAIFFRKPGKMSAQASH